MEDDFFRIHLSPVLIGLCAGALMAFGVLKLLDRGMRPLPAYVLCLAAPACLDFVKRRGISASITETVMILVSLVLCCVYSVQSAMDGVSLRHMLMLCVPVHWITLGLNIARIMWVNHGKGAQS